MGRAGIEPATLGLRVDAGPLAPAGTGSGVDHPKRVSSVVGVPVLVAVISALRSP